MLFGLVLVIRDGLLKNLFNYLSAKHIFTYLKLGLLLVSGGLAINISYQYLPIMEIIIKASPIHCLGLNLSLKKK